MRRSASGALQAQLGAVPETADSGETSPASIVLVGHIEVRIVGTSSIILDVPCFL
jgi:hypothetical protein